MAISIKEETLQLALESVGLRSLPKKHTASDRDLWVRGIALVSKCGGIHNYVLVENEGEAKITRDFGACRAILKIEEIYPYDFLERIDTPDLRSDNAIITFLSRNGYNAAEIEALLLRTDKDSETIKADKAKVKTYVTKVALKLAKRKREEEDRVRKMKTQTQEAHEEED